MLVAGAQLLLWGWSRRSGLVKPVLPTSAPFWLDRLVSAAALTAGIGLVVLAVVELARGSGRALHNRNRQRDRIGPRELERDLERLADDQRLGEVDQHDVHAPRRERHGGAGAQRARPTSSRCMPIAPLAVVTASCISV